MADVADIRPLFFHPLVVVLLVPGRRSTFGRFPSFFGGGEQVPILLEVSEVQNYESPSWHDFGEVFLMTTDEEHVLKKKEQVDQGRKHG
jgi:hypothetical protein